MGSRGFTLIEVVVVVLLVAFLVTIATLDFNSWIKKYQTESQTREMYADLEQLRLNAIQRKQRTAVYFGPNSYVFRVLTSAGLPQPYFRKTFNYEIKKGLALATFNIATDIVEFDSRGLTSNPLTIVVTPVQYGAGDNCIVISAGQTNLGRMLNASTCQPR